jgi:hypothetical protein
MGPGILESIIDGVLIAGFLLAATAVVLAIRFAQSRPAAQHVSDKGEDNDE